MKKFAIAFDTSNEIVAVGLGMFREDGRIEFVDSRFVSANRASNQLLLTTIDDICSTNDVNRDDIALVGIGRGPGSFTGVRIAIATVKGICFALSIPCVGISTLDVIAENARRSGYRGDLFVVADAMRKEVYPAKYEILDQEVRRLSADKVVKADKFFSELPVAAVLCGDALSKFAQSAKNYKQLDEDLWHPTGESLIALLKDRKPESAEFLLPIYTRLSDAEEAEREKLKDNSARNLVSGVQGDTQVVEVRPCRADDASNLAALESDNFSSDCWGEDQFREDLRCENRIWYKAVRGTKFLGYIGACVNQDTADILKVCVDKEFRRQHIATKLISQLLDDLRNLSVREVFLEVRASNVSARSFYEKIGFKQCGERANYFGNENAICYKLLEESFVRDVNIDKTSIEIKELEHPLIFAFESSCDETASAIVDGNDNILSSIISSSASFHARFGGVVPEIASRKHVEVISQVASAALSSASVSLRDIDAIAVTNRPGLVGSLVVGCAFAKAISWATDKPLIFVDHLEGHLYANKLAEKIIEFPCVASLISGGNTMLVEVDGWGKYKILGQTIDDAVGEAYDKIAREFGLPYPGGPQISKLAAQGDASRVDLPRPLLHSHDFRMSLSGLKTAVILAIEKLKEQNNGELLQQDMCNICASFEKSVSDVQVAKAREACKQTKAKSFCFGGGVAANANLRSEYIKMCDELNIEFIVSPNDLCGDNAAMIGLVAQDLYKSSCFEEITGDVSARSTLDGNC